MARSTYEIAVTRLVTRAAHDALHAIRANADDAWERSCELAALLLSAPDARSGVAADVLHGGPHWPRLATELAAAVLDDVREDAAAARRG